MARKLSLLLLLATLLVYSAVRRHGFVDYDDPLYVTDNYRVMQGLSWANAAWALTSFEIGNWHPLTWLSHLADWTLFGPHPAGHHWMSVALHAANAVLLFWLLYRLTGLERASFLAAALFALHPLNVESVAWVAERKNVLSLFLGLGSTLFYVTYVRQRNRPSYFASIALFGAALMSKPMVVTLPFLFLLLDIWPLGRMDKPQTQLKSHGPSRDRKPSGRIVANKPGGAPSPQALKWLLLEKTPFLLLSIGSSVLTLLAQARSGDVVGLDSLPLGSRGANAAVSYVCYVSKFLWPSQLAVFYPYNTSGMYAWKVLGSVLILIAVSVAVIFQRRKRSYLAVGWFWFLGSAFPTIGIVQSGGQAQADRYAYLPMIGLAIIIIWSIEEFISRIAMFRSVWPVLAGIGLLVLAITTVRQVRTWADDHTLFLNALKVSENNPVALQHLGSASLREGRTDEAIQYFKDSIEANQRRNTIDLHHVASSMQGLSNAYLQEAKKDQALYWIRESLGLNPHSPSALQDLALLLAEEGKNREALETIELALKQPSPPHLIANLLANQGTLLAKVNRIPEALRSFKEAAAYDRRNVQAFINLGALLLTQGNFDDAGISLQHANSIHPTASAFFLLGLRSSKLGREAEAIQLYRQSLALDPNYSKAREQLAFLAGKPKPVQEKGNVK